MDLANWGAGRMILLLGATFFVAAFFAIGILFRHGGDSYAVSEGTRAAIGFLLGGGVAAAWLLLLISSAFPQLRSNALILLIVACLANMAVPSFLPSAPPPAGGQEG